MQVVIPALRMLLTDLGDLEIAVPEADEPDDGPVGGEPNIDVEWIGRGKWDRVDPPCDREAVGVCHIRREDTVGPRVITKASGSSTRRLRPTSTSSHRSA